MDEPLSNLDAWVQARGRQEANSKAESHEMLKEEKILDNGGFVLDIRPENIHISDGGKIYCDQRTGDRIR